ncbi:DMT family transporter [Phyllobacterium salinisoli]|uniref:DMT family transporter n=1 Tax=Phyllobacterium salinisoli TaxID=1899321 RepID=A0A368KBF6_9HYPH|nr:DMT family transporter [Phyllobacterium salinisoli]RCS25742.1 DMT family transporter [Phyllobacterium salinisoli]
MLNGIILAFASYAAYAFSDACVKFLDGSLSPYQIAFFGALFGLTALPFMKRENEGWRDIFITRNKPMWLLRTIMATSGVIGSVVAFTYLSMAEAFALIFLLPAFVTILSVIFLKEPVGWRRWSAVAIGFAGVLIVLRPGFRELSLGHLGALIAGFSGAVGIIIFRVMGNSEKRITLYSSGLFGPIIICGLLTALTGYANPTPEQWIYLAGYGLLAALASILLMVAARRAPASAIASPQYSQMIWAVLFGYFVFHDTIDLPMLTGIILIIISGLFTFIREEQKGVAKPLSVATSEPGPVLTPEEASPDKSA